MVRRLLLLALLAPVVLAQSMPPPSKVENWKSPYNQKRLKLSWEVLPEYKPTKLPDGTEEPPKAPWPFLVYVHQVDSKASEKLQERVFSDTRFILATRAVKPIEIRPDKVFDIPYLSAVQGVKDPTLIFVNRDFGVETVLNSPREFTDRKVLDAMEDLVKEAYETKLGAYVGAYVDLLEEGEKLWRVEEKMDQLRSRAAKADPGKAAKYDQEADELERELAPQREKLMEAELAVQDSLVLKGTGRKEEVATTFGQGKKRRELTPQEIEAIETYNEFKRNDNPIVRAAAVEDLGAIDSAPIVATILEAANDIDPRVVEAAGKALGRMKSPEALEAMLAGLDDSNSKSRTAALLGFAYLEVPYGPAVKKIASMARSGNDELKRAAIKALHNLKDPIGAEALLAALDDREDALRVLAAEALGDMRIQGAAPKLIEKLEDSDWSLRKAAAQALGKIRAKEAVEPLLKRFETEEGLLEEIYHDALVSITGQDFLYNRENWRKWWDKYGTGFILPTDAEIAEAKKKAAEALKGYYNPNKRKYGKIETLSRKMVFVIDISSSMNDKIVIPPYAPKEVQEEYPERVKIEIAKKDLINLLAEIDSNVYFNIITFAGKAEPWKDGLVSGSMRTAAIKYVSKLKALEPARGGRKVSSGAESKTNTYGALMAAFGLADEEIPNWKSRTKVDTIFFITDGLPTAGVITDVPKLVDFVTELNRSRGVIIHVIVFGPEEARKLRSLAERNGGQIVVHGWDGTR